MVIFVASQAARTTGILWAIWMAVPLQQLVKHLEDSGVLAGDTLADFIPPKAAPKDAEELIRQLMRQKNRRKRRKKS